MTSPLRVDFAGEEFLIEPDGGPFTVGRQGTLSLEDNPYLHREFLSISWEGGWWWVHNIGGRLAASLTDRRAVMRSTLAPGARLPLVFPETILTFSAGTTSYEIDLFADIEGYVEQVHCQAVGETTRGSVTFTDSQILAILALAEPLLKRVGSGPAQLPTSVQAAKRLGWKNTRFNRKLDNVCDKLDKAGVSGLHGGPGSNAMNRRARLVDYAISTLLVTADDLPLLQAEADRNRPDSPPAAGARRPTLERAGRARP